MPAENSLSWKVANLQLLKNRILAVSELQDWYWYKKSGISWSTKLQTVCFFIFSNSDKKYTVWNLSSLGKKAFFWKKKCNSKSKVKFEKTLCSFVLHDISLRLINISTVLVEPFDRSVRYREPLLFTFSVNKSFSLKKKIMTVTPFHFRFYKSVQIFITIERIIKVFIILGIRSLKQDLRNFCLLFCV